MGEHRLDRLALQRPQRAEPPVTGDGGEECVEHDGGGEVDRGRWAEISESAIRRAFPN